MSRRPCNDNWNKVFQNGSTKICGKKIGGVWSVKYFKGRPPQVLLGPINVRKLNSKSN